MPAFSVIIPAYNEAAFLPATLEAIKRAEAALGLPVEIIVADNLSTDQTPAIARQFGARVVEVSRRCISTVRNQGARAATGDYLVFVDADNRMSENMLVEIKRQMDSGRYIGGGITHARYDRASMGIRLTHGLVSLGVRLSRLSMFLFYTTPETFEALGGFDESLLSTEDYEFAKRLKRYGKHAGKRYLNLSKGELVLSSRKFTEYGDWTVFRHPLMFLRACFNDPEVAYELWYKPEKR